MDCGNESITDFIPKVISPAGNGFTRITTVVRVSKVVRLGGPRFTGVTSMRCSSKVIGT